MDLPRWDGWKLLGAFPDNEPDDVGSWLLHHGGEAALLEVPPGLTVSVVQQALRETGTVLRYVLASHRHEDHLDKDAWRALTDAFPEAEFISGCNPKERLLHLGGEPLWVIKAPKHSWTDLVTIFRGVAMMGDIELGMVESVNREVSVARKVESMAWLRGFPGRTGYHVHSIISAHLNDVRTSVCWPDLFRV